MYRCFFLLIVVLSPFSVPAETRPSLVFNVTGTPPLNTLSNNGFMDEVTREALERINHELVIVKMPAERGLHSLNKGLIDAEMSRVATLDKQYTNLVRVPEKIIDWEFVVFAKSSIDLKQGWRSLENKNVAFINGWKILEKNVPKSAIITKVKNSKQLFFLLDKERVDLIIFERWGGHSIIKNLGLEDVKMLQPSLANKEMYIYLHKKHKGLVPQLTKALVDMKADGSYARLVKKHLSTLINK